MAVIEYAKNVKKIIDANSTEISKKCKNPVIDLMTNQKEIINKGGTMRLGAWDCQIIKDTKSYSIYNKKLISERHRHRYEVNNSLRSLFEKSVSMVAIPFYEDDSRSLLPILHEFINKHKLTKKRQTN